MSEWMGNEVFMVFDGETGNAIDSGDYTIAELERRIAELRGWLTVDSLPPSASVSSSLAAAPPSPEQERNSE